MPYAWSMPRLDYQTAGESHGPAVISVITGLPANLQLDMDFINAKHTAARDIALAFGVPPQLLGIPGDNTYSNMREARLALWEETVLPLIDQIAAELNNWLVPRFGDGLELAHDLDAPPALGLRRERHWEKLNKADFITINEKRAAAGYGAIAGGDVLPEPRRNRRERAGDSDAGEGAA